MANSIALFKQFVPLLDEVYKEASKTARCWTAARSWCRRARTLTSW